MSLKLESPVTAVKGVGEKYKIIFEKKGIHTVFDLLLQFPVHYIDFGQGAGIDPEEKKVYYLEIDNYKFFRLSRRRLSIITVNTRLVIPNSTPAPAGTDETVENNEAVHVQVVFFNRPYMLRFLKDRGNRRLCIYGKLEPQAEPRQTAGKRAAGKPGAVNHQPGSTAALYYRADNPLFFPGKEVQGEGIMPLYRKLGTIKSGNLRKIIANVWSELADQREPLPADALVKYKFLGLVETLHRIHQPGTVSEEIIERLKYRFIYEEFLFYQLELQVTRNFFKKVPRVNYCVFDGAVHHEVKKNLEFELTPDQLKAYEDIAADMQSEFAMQRLLQGDVGSGKTIVAFMAMAGAQLNGYQAALLAPTEILAQQHYRSAQRFFKTCSIDILTGSTPAKTRREMLHRLASGEIHILFGTHALLNEGVVFKHLSLVVIDEQHRFGVAQRAALYYKGNNADLLVTTATPIPRTMLLSLYGDLSVSVIKTKPRGRLPIITKIIPARGREEFYEWLKKNAAKGVKVYIILPLIEESEFFPELKSIERQSVYFEELFADIPIGIVSGRTATAEKDAVLADFAAGKIRVLVATTVIEVGIDVKDAAIIVIEDADRYGLSQLHQLRGRVGRGEIQSYCFLIPSANISESGKQRLRTIETQDDGFKIAEIDLEMRGGGLIPGLEQSGNLDFRFGDMKKDYKIFKAARYDAGLIVEGKLAGNEHTAKVIKEVEAKIERLNFS